MNIIIEALTLKNAPLFQGIAFGDLERMCDCMSAEATDFKKEEVILLSGDTINNVGLIVSGRVRIVKEDINGHSSILAELTAPELFGEVFACAGITQSPVTVQAAEDSAILFINYKKIITTCASACSFHARLIENMLKLVAEKNLALSQKIEILSKRTTREKLMCYFDSYRGAEKKFAIPFNREGLARYLCVDRSGMSNELCKMRDEGLIKFRKNEFEIF